MSEDFHVIHVIPLDSGGGAEGLVRDLHAGLSASGISCERVHFCGEFQSHANGTSTNVTHFGLSHDSLRNVLRLRQLLKVRLRQSRRVILHSHLTHGFIFALLATRGLPLTWLHTEHSTTARFRRIRAPLERELYRCCRMVVAISEGVRQALQNDLSLPPERIRVIHNGAKSFSPVERPGFKGREIQFVSVGSLNSRKGFDISLRALAAVTIGPWKYTIVGEGPERQNLSDLARSLGIAEHIRLVGWADPEPYLAGADLQLIPSRWEGFGLVAVEGMSSGLRIIGSHVDGLREVLGLDPDIGRLVEEHTRPAAWSEAISAEVERLKSVRRLSSAASIKRARHFTIPRMVEGYVQLYGDLMGEA